MPTHTLPCLESIKGDGISVLVETLWTIFALVWPPAADLSLNVKDQLMGKKEKTLQFDL